MNTNSTISNKSGTCQAVKRYGATPEEWEAAISGGYVEYLVPIISDMTLPVSKNAKSLWKPTTGGYSKMLGKIPSMLNRKGEVVGCWLWSERNTNKGDVETWASHPAYGYGIRCGVNPKSLRGDDPEPFAFGDGGPLIAIDCDTEDSEILAKIKNYLDSKYPGAPCRGRADSAKVLYLLRTVGNPEGKRDLTLPEGLGVIELRSNGTQFAAAGTHPKGARYQWFGGLKPIDQLPLIEDYAAFCAEIAEAAGGSLTAPAKSKMVGDVAALDYEGEPLYEALAARGLVGDIKVSKGISIICPFKHGSGSNEDDTSTIYMPPGRDSNGNYLPANINCEHDTCKDVHKRTLKDYLTELAVKDFKFCEEATAEGFSLIDTPKTEIHSEDEELSDDEEVIADDLYTLETPVAILREIETWIGTQSEKPIKEINQLASLVFACTVAGRKFRSTNRNWSSMYFTLIATTGTGKNYLRQSIERLLQHCGLSDYIGAGFYTSSAGVFSALLDKPNHVCIADEFGEHFLESRKANNTNRLTAFSALKKAFSDQDGSYKNESYSSLDVSKDKKAKLSKTIHIPSITFCGLATPNQFFGEIREQHIEGGLLNRIVIVQSPAYRGKRLELGSVDVPSKIIEHVAKVREAVGFSPEVVKQDIDFGDAKPGSVEHFEIATAAMYGSDTEVAPNPIDQLPNYDETPCDVEPTPVEVVIDDAAKQLFDRFGDSCDAREQELATIKLSGMANRWREQAMRLSTGLAAFDNPSKPRITEPIAKFCTEYVQHWGEKAAKTLQKQSSENETEEHLKNIFKIIRKAGKGGMSTKILSQKYRALHVRARLPYLDSLCEMGAIKAKLTFFDKDNTKYRYDHVRAVVNTLDDPKLNRVGGAV